MYYITRIVVFERTYILSYSRFQSDARQDEGVIFFLTLTMEKLRFFLFYFIFSFGGKQVLLELM